MFRKINEQLKVKKIERNCIMNGLDQYSESFKCYIYMAVLRSVKRKVERR